MCVSCDSLMTCRLSTDPTQPYLELNGGYFLTLYPPLSICLGSVLCHSESVIILWSCIGVRGCQNVKASIFEDKLWMMVLDWWSLSLCPAASSLICNCTLVSSHSIFFSCQPPHIYLVSSLSFFFCLISFLLFLHLFLNSSTFCINIKQHFLSLSPPVALPLAHLSLPWKNNRLMFMLISCSTLERGMI